MNNAFRILKKAAGRHMGLPPVSLQEEVEPYIPFLKGVVLNAGAGHRPLELPIPAITCDFDSKANVDFLADLHYLPLRDSCVDSVLSVAVLEHTRYPWVCAGELHRVLRPGGVAVICVPFLQPEHAVPHDFFRYTAYGLQALLEFVNFRVERVDRLGRFHRALAWLILEKWHSRPMAFLANAIARQAVTFETEPKSAYTGCYAVAHKAGESGPLPIVTSGNFDRAEWLANNLVDPVSKSPLHPEPQGLRNERNEIYVAHGGKVDLRPHGALSQDHETKWR